MMTIEDVRRGLEEVEERMRSLAAEAVAAEAKRASAEKRAQDAEQWAQGLKEEAASLGAQLAETRSAIANLKAQVVACADTARAMNKRCLDAESERDSLRAQVESLRNRGCDVGCQRCGWRVGGECHCPASLRGGAEPKGPPEFEPVQAYASRDRTTLSIGPGFTTIRACRGCGVLVTGGPTACSTCSKKQPKAEPLAPVFRGGPAPEHYVVKASQTAWIRALIASLPSPSSPKTGRWKCVHCGHRLLWDACRPDVFEVSNASGRWTWGVDCARQWRWYHFCDDGRTGYSCDRIGDAPEVTP